MKRKELQKIPVRGCTDDLRTLAQNAEKRERRFRVQEDACCRVGIDQNILTLDLYVGDLSTDILPSYRIFIDREAEDFITYDVADQKWRSARLDHLIEYGWNEIYAMPEEEACMKDYLGIKGFQDLLLWQQRVREQQRIAAYERNGRKWDAIMEQVPPHPKDLETWLKRHVIKEHYMFYEYKKHGPIKGRCTRCGKEQILSKPKYNRAGTCKHCRHPVIFKSIGKCRKILTKRFCGHVLQPAGDGVVSRQFRAFSVYEGLKPPILYFYEERRLLIGPSGQANAYYWGQYLDEKMHWIQTNVCEKEPYYLYDDPRWYSRCGDVYRRTLPNLSKKQLKKTGLLEIVRAGIRFSPEIYLLAAQVHPIIEKAAKAGLPKLAIEFASNTWSLTFPQEGALHRCLVIDREQLHRLRSNQGGRDYLNWLQHEKEWRRIDDSVIKWFLEAEIEPYDLQFLNGRMRPRQVMNYLKKQMEKMSTETARGVLGLWRDYLRMAEQCGENVHDAIVYRASDLKKRHDEVVHRLEEIEDQKKIECIEEKYPMLPSIFQSLEEKYSYQDRDYTVVVPKDVADLIHEGNSLHHCINTTDGYYERIASRESYLLFLRRTNEPSVPYYTLEVEPGGTVRQKRTEYNRQTEDIGAITRFLEKWQKIVAKRMTREDIQLAEKSKRRRKELYDKLRRNGQRIQQGNYAGQQLVELLEADLMEIENAA